MAIVKTINKSTKGHGALKNCLKYISRNNEVNSDLCYVSGPGIDSDFDYKKIFNDFIDEKTIWNKDSGRMYVHNIISFHECEDISLVEVLNFGKEFADRWYDGFQSAVVVHTDKKHKHIHIVTNTVSYIDGHKYHQSQRDMEKMNDLVNEMSRSRGLSVPEKGKNFFGEKIERKTIRAYNKDKYNLLKRHPEKSFLCKALSAIHEAIKGCECQEKFIEKMQELGWKVHISDKRKYITLEDENGNKVRDSRLSNTFNINFNKESLQQEFEKNINRANVEFTDLGELELEREFSPYYQKVEKAVDIDDVDDLEVDPTLENKEIWNAEMQRVQAEHQGCNKKTHKKKHDEFEHER